MGVRVELEEGEEEKGVRVGPKGDSQRAHVSFDRKTQAFVSSFQPFARSGFIELIVQDSHHSNGSGKPKVRARTGSTARPLH